MVVAWESVDGVEQAHLQKFLLSGNALPDAMLCMSWALGIGCLSGGLPYPSKTDSHLEANKKLVDDKQRHWTPSLLPCGTVVSPSKGWALMWDMANPQGFEQTASSRRT